MKNICLAVKAIPALEPRIVFYETIEFAKENDCMVELHIDGVQVYCLPQSTIEEVTRQYKDKLGR